MLAGLIRKFATLARPQGLPTVRADGRVWHLTPAGVALFGPSGPQPERWVADGTATVVKANPARTVYRAALAGATVFVKHCRVTGPRSWLREATRLPKARLEFDNSLALRERGVSAVEPLAWGASDSHWPGESFVITRGIAAVPLQHYLEREFPALGPREQRATRRQLALALAEFLARLHDAGIDHPDPHPGNLLVEVPACRVPRFTLLDLHDVRLGPPLPWAASRHNLALFNRYFQMRAGRPDRARFWHAYRRARLSLRTPTGTETAAEAKDVEQTTHASNLRLWAGRERRWLGSNRSIRRVRHGSVRGFAVRDLPEEFLRGLLAEPDGMLAAAGLGPERERRGGTTRPSPLAGEGGGASPPGEGLLRGSGEEPLTRFVRSAHEPPSPARGEGNNAAPPSTPGFPGVARLLKDCLSSTVAVLTMPTPAGPVPVVLKRVNARNWTDPVKNLLRRSEVLRSWASGHALRDRWLPTPRPLAVFHRYRRGLPAEGFLLTEMVPGAIQLDAAAHTGLGRETIFRLGRVLRAMHDRGVSHRDLKAPNILLAHGTDPVLIDLVGVRTRVRLTVARRAKELARLSASFAANPAVTHGERLRFLRAYLGAGPSLRVGWKSWWKLVSELTAAKVARNRRAGRVLG